MTSSSDIKATSASVQRFNDYHDRLRNEFEPQSNTVPTKSSCPRRFGIYLGGLKGEFELMFLEIESLRKERDEYKEKVGELQAKELLDVRQTFVCERCSKGTVSAHGTPASSQAKPMKTTPSRSSLQVKSLEKPGTSDSSRGVNVTHEMTTHQDTTHTQKATRIRSVSHTTTKCSETIANSRAASLPSPLPQISASIVDTHSDPQWTITFNNKVEKEIDVEMLHALSHKEQVWCVKFSQDGKYIAAGCRDAKVYIYHVETGALTRVLRNLLAKVSTIKAVCFSRDGRYLAAGSSDGSLYIWEINTKYVRNAFKGHTRYIMSLDFSPNGRLLVSASADNTIRLWNIRDGATKFLTEDNPTFLDDPCYNSAVFSPDGRYVAASHQDEVVRIWDVCTGQLLRRVKHMYCVYDVVFTQDGKGLLSGGMDRTLKYWDISSLYTARFPPGSQARNALARDSTVVEEQETRPGLRFSGHTRSVYSITLSPDGRWVASGSSDRSVRIWDTRNAKTQCIINHDDEIRTVDFSPAGNYLAAGQGNGILRVWKYSHMAPRDRTRRVTEIGRRLQKELLPSNLNFQ